MNTSHTVEQAVKIARKLGYPVVLKVHSHTITHKSDVGGVKLCLRSAAPEVEAAACEVVRRVKDELAACRT